MDTVTTIGITGLDIMNASLQEIPFTATSATVTIQEEPPLSVTPQLQRTVRYLYRQWAGGHSDLR